MEFGNKIKSEWLLDDNVTFLNHGSFGATPIKVLKAKEEIERRLEREPLSFFADEYFVLLKESVSKLSKFIGAKEENLVLVENATTGVNTVLHSLEKELKPGDEIITTNHVYQGVRNTMEYICKKTGAKAIEIDIPFPNADNKLIIEKIRDKINEKTKILIIDHIASPTALIFPIKELIDFCRSKGILTLVDGAHAPGMLDLNLEMIGADFYTGNCHKWMFTPKSCAFLSVSKKWQSMIKPLTISLFYGKSFSEEFAWTGTKNPAPFLSLSPAIDFYNSLNFDNVKDYNHNLVCEATEFICKELNIPEFPDFEMLGFMASIEFPVKVPMNEHLTMELRNHFMKEYKIELSFHILNSKVFFRISSQVYNEIEDYKKLVTAMKDFISKNK
ncbi:MAG: aminotransferase class V-fold PLP-dependent enzyme [Ignavibacteriae bacterium]|nr:aminotransferase class V-fold PLP-dependent enzyme [Ignavibacteriota bacterium]